MYEKSTGTEQKGLHNTTWKIINSISGQGNTPNTKVKKCDGSSPSSDKEVLSEWDHTWLSYLIMTTDPSSFTSSEGLANLY